MIEDKATERWKKRLKDMGLIVNMGAGRPKPSSTEKSTVGTKKATPGKPANNQSKKK